MHLHATEESFPIEFLTHLSNHVIHIGPVESAAVLHIDLRPDFLLGWDEMDDDVTPPPRALKRDYSLTQEQGQSSYTVSNHSAIERSAYASPSYRSHFAPRTAPATAAVRSPE